MSEGHAAIADAIHELVSEVRELRRYLRDISLSLEQLAETRPLDEPQQPAQVERSKNRTR